MNAIEKVLPANTINLAQAELIAHLDGLKDAADQKLFESVASGIWVPKDNPNGNNTPAARVWYRKPLYHDISPQFFAGIRYVDFAIGIYLWLSTKDGDDNVVDPQQVMVDWADYVLQSLQLLDVNGTGWIWSGDFWGPKVEQDIIPDFGSQMRKYNNDVPLQPPWYAVEIPFQVEVYNKTS